MEEDQSVPSLTYKSEQIVNMQWQIEVPLATGKTILSGSDDEDIATHHTLTITGVTVHLARPHLAEFHMYGFATTRQSDRCHDAIQSRDAFLTGSFSPSSNE